MNSKKVALIDFIIFFAAYMITDKIFPEANELLKLFLSVALVLLGTFVAKELFKYDEENDNDE